MEELRLSEKARVAKKMQDVIEREKTRIYRLALAKKKARKIDTIKNRAMMKIITGGKADGDLS